MKLTLSKETLMQFFKDAFLTSYCDIQGDLVNITVNSASQSEFLTLHIAEKIPSKEIKDA